MYAPTDTPDLPPGTIAIRDAALVEPEAVEDLSFVLRRYFGHDTFRPLQEDIVRDTLAGRDVLALMPTGGGKSLCYQLPALVRPGLTVVVSPLIALMKDQVDALDKEGIPAALINSTLSAMQMQEVVAGLDAGRYRLLYVAPERLMTQAFLNQLTGWNVAMFAIDEAHCISDWGHDFRPEYRKLRELRLRFPDVPMMGLTATATERVRDDIVTQLGFREAGVYVASFNRPNLTYRIEPKKQPYQRLLDFLGRRKGQSGIIYCHTRKATEGMAEKLRKDGYQAVPYHAGLEQGDRARHQELFLADRVQIVCATIAFGMGVNKPNIRFVVHYDIPKNIESYYQETGRAGRDGDPADCLLFLGQHDVFNHERRIEEKQTRHEQEIARQALEAVVEFAESKTCRRRALLAYFGEDYGSLNCGSCDNCTGTADRIERRDDAANGEPVPVGPLQDRTQDARRFLACLNEIVKVSGFSVGAGHVADVIWGSESEKIRRWGHEGLKWYGTGKHASKDDWNRVGKALVEGGYIERRGDRLPVLTITERGKRLLAGEGGTVDVPMPAPKTDGVAPYDVALFERLRKLRSRIAAERKVAAFVVFADVALQQMSRDYPVTPDAFRRVSGVGQVKLADLGSTFMSEIKDYVRIEGKKQFEAPPTVQMPREKRYLGESERDTFDRFKRGETVEQIAAERGLKEGTITNHLVAAAELGEEVDLCAFVAPEYWSEIRAAFDSLGWANVTGVREMLRERFDFPALRVYRAVTLNATRA